MKKLIAISVVFALVAGAVFAVDVTGTVFGHYDVLKGDTGKDSAGNSNKVTAGGGMDRIRLDGAGEAGDGAFGGYIRTETHNHSVGKDDALQDTNWDGEPDSIVVNGPGGFYGNAWWKPIDQFKLLIGSNGGDGFIGKEGVTGWMFQQTAYDTGVLSDSAIIRYLVEHPAGNPFFAPESIRIFPNDEFELVNGFPPRVSGVNTNITTLVANITAESAITGFTGAINTNPLHSAARSYFVGRLFAC